MAVASFPDAPVQGQVHDRWTWNGLVWEFSPSPRFVRSAGDNLTGQLNGITPVAGANLTRKDYVDLSPTYNFVQETAPVATKVGQTWFNLTTGAGTSWVALDRGDGVLVWVQTDFSVPQGDTGPVGPTGPQGATGPPGGGLIAWKYGTLPAGTVLSTTPITIYSIAASLDTGRAYEIMATSRALYSTAYVRITMAVAPTITGFTADAYVYAPANYGSIAWPALIFPTVTQTYTFTVQAAGSGTGAVWTELNCSVWIKDIGPAVAQSP